eukprot:569475-Pelagomonas_calceolata.AAC.7
MLCLGPARRSLDLGNDGAKVRAVSDHLRLSLDSSCSALASPKGSSRASRTAEEDSRPAEEDSRPAGRQQASRGRQAGRGRQQASRKTAGQQRKTGRGSAAQCVCVRAFKCVSVCVITPTIQRCPRKPGARAWIKGKTCRMDNLVLI